MGRIFCFGFLAIFEGAGILIDAVLIEKAYETVMTLLPKVTGLSSDERRELTIRLKELRVALDRLPAEIVQWYTA